MMESQLVRQLDTELETNTPILLIGLGALGFSIMNYLKQRDMENVKVITKYKAQEELVRAHDYQPVNYRTPPKGLENAVIIDTIGNEQSIIVTQNNIMNGGIYVDAALSSLKFRSPLQAHSVASDLIVINGKHFYLVVPFWASRENYKSSVSILPNVLGNVPNIEEFLQLISIQDAFDLIKGRKEKDRNSIAQVMDISGVLSSL